MTKEEAIKAMENHRVTHPNMCGMWATRCTNGMYTNSDKKTKSEEEVLKELEELCKDDESWLTNWEIYGE